MPVGITWGRARLLLVLAASASSLGACKDPCTGLERYVCETLEDEERCMLLQDPLRREHLTRAACAGMLERLESR